MFLTKMDFVFFIVELVIISGLLFTLLGIGLYIIYRDMHQRETEFEIKMAAAQASSDSHIMNMPYSELKKILDDNMKYYVQQNVLISGILNVKTDEERSLMINNIIIATCADVDTSISNKVRTALLNYVPDTHLKIYIKNTVRLLIVAEVEHAGITSKIKK